MATRQHSDETKRGPGVWLQWATLGLCAAILVVVLWPEGKRSGNADQVDERITLASKMLGEGLHAEAIAEYEAALDLAGNDARRKANLCYLIGKTYFERVKDYEKALASFARARYYNANHPESARMQKWSVECLERLGRSLDAHNRMARATALRPDDLPGSATVVARIGDQAITLADLEAEIRRLPSNLQEGLTGPKDKVRFLEQHVARRLMVDAAQRVGLARDPQVLKEIDRVRDEILLAAYFRREIEGPVTVTPEEVQLYYETHRDEFMGPKAFDLSHVELPDEAAATSAAAALDGGADFAALAREKSANRETGEKGGRLGTWTEDRPLPAALGNDAGIRSAVSRLKRGERTAPLKTKSGAFHIVRADDVSTPTVRPFAEVRATIEARRRQEKTLKRQEEVLARLRAAEKVVIYPEAFEGAKESK